MKNTGVWTKCELDDEGNISLVIHAAAEWQVGETVTIGEIITDKVPESVLSKLKETLSKVIAAANKSMMENAEKAAVEMRNFKLGRRDERILKLDFTADLKTIGSEVKNAS